MYLVSIYFDEKTNKRIQQYINAVAEKSGNKFMLDGNVPPHITVSAFETRDERAAIAVLEQAVSELQQGELQWASVGQFFPYVIYIAPVLNEYLHGMSEKIYRSLSGVEGILVNQYYKPFQWLPHTTIGKKLSKDEMSMAFEILQNSFGVFNGEVVKVGLAKPNPHRDIVTWEI
ncbi:MAG: 2'-5' RNA ligase family protein [Tyzzerella sp.]|nr:2'-5' RNA ligase family protein [Tyzzerella sp.]